MVVICPCPLPPLVVVVALPLGRWWWSPVFLCGGGVCPRPLWWWWSLPLSPSLSVVVAVALVVVVRGDSLVVSLCFLCCWWCSPLLLWWCHGFPSAPPASLSLAVKGHMLDSGGHRPRPPFCGANRPSDVVRAWRTCMLRPGLLVEFMPTKQRCSSIR